MNGSKNFLLVIILILALLPWGFLFVLLQSEDGAKLLGLDGLAAENSGVSQEDADEMEAVISTQKEKILELEDSLAQAQNGANPIISQTDLDELQDSLEQLKLENREAENEIQRLRAEYSSALSKVVQMKTEQLAAEAVQPPALPQPAPSPSPSPQPKPKTAPAAPAANSTPQNSGGWILPPPN